jgi:hypothetical protein
MRRRPSPSLVFAVVAITACGSAQRSKDARAVGNEPGGENSAAAVTLDDAAVKALIEGVSAGRAVPVKGPIAIDWVSPSDFERSLRSHVRGDEDAGALSADEAVMLGLDFLPPPDKRLSEEKATELLLKEILAYYDIDEKRIVIPRVSITSEEELLKQEAVLAHEVHHALQAQNFPAQERRASSSDERLATLSLIEGDAMVAMAAFLGTRAGAPVGRTLRRLREVTKGVPRDAIARESSDAERLGASDLSRARLSFPYDEGMLFVSDVYRAGGFPLVDQIYAQPPTTTEHILHPERFLRGERPHEFAAFAPDGDVTIVARDTLGELQIRVMLSRCNELAVAERAANGWSGDRFHAVKVGGQLGIAWATAWDSEAEAREFEGVLRGSSACFGANSLDGFTIGAETAVQRRGSSVAFVRGVPERGRKLLDAMLALPKPPKPAVRITDREIPPRVELPEPIRGRLDGDVYRNDWLGLAARTPKGMTAKLPKDEDVLDVSISRKGTLVFGGLAISTRITSDAENERTFARIRDGFQEVVEEKGLRLSSGTTSSRRTELGAAVVRTYSVKSTPVKVRIVLVPICAGTGSLVFLQSYADEFAESVLDGWVASFRMPENKNLPACDFLDPK